MAAVAELLLLDSSPGVLHRLESEPDDVEGVEDRDGIGEFVIDGVGVATEGVQSGDSSRLW